MNSFDKIRNHISVHEESVIKLLEIIKREKTKLKFAEEINKITIEILFNKNIAMEIFYINYNNVVLYIGAPAEDVIDEFKKHYPDSFIHRENSILIPFPNE